LETIYGAGASNVVYKEESEKKLTLMIAALGSKQVLDAAASAGLKKSEIKALEKAIKEQEAAALLAAKREELLNQLHKIELGKDPAKNKYVADEAITGSLLESQLGVKLSRSLDEGADWVNPANGTKYDGCSPPPSSYFDEKTFNLWKESLNKHLYMEQASDVVVVDLKTRGITSEQAKMIKEHISSIKDTLKKIIIIE